MTKASGVIGYATGVDEQRPGVHKEIITEFPYSGDVIRNSRSLRETDKVSDDITVSNSISIVADAFARAHFFDIRYVTWAGAVWKVAEVTPESPRLVLRLGGVYRGPRPAPEPQGEAP